MNSFKDIIQQCHQRHKKPLRQRRTVVIPAPYKGLPYQYMVYCAWRHPVRLYELEHADISMMPIGRAPEHDHGPMDLGGDRFLSPQGIEDWNPQLWRRSWGIQVYTGIPSQRDGAQWHDIEFKYEAISVAPDAVSTCIETFINAVANPLLTMTKNGGIRFSCRIPDYLHPNTDEAKHYIYKHTPTAENLHQRDIYLKILGDQGYSRWDARYEILIGNLLDPPIIAKEVLFTAIDAVHAELHEPASSEDEKIISISEDIPIVPPSLGSHNLDLAKQAFLKRGFSYLRQENGFYYWTQHTGKIDDGSILLWESNSTVWVRATTPDTGLSTNPTPITDVWHDTGILAPIPASGLPISEKIRVVREGKLSPLAIKRPTPVLHKQEHANKTYETLDQNTSQIQNVFDKTARITGLIAETGAGKTHGVETYLLNGGAISLNARPRVVNKIGQRFEKHNLPYIHCRPRQHLWNRVKEVPVEVRMASPFERGNVCEDPERCDALEKKGGNPSESICPQCPVYTECQQRGYLSQFTTLQNTYAHQFGISQLFLNPLYSEMVEEILKPVDNIERLCIIDEAQADELFFECNVTKRTLEKWSVDWQKGALGNFAKALLNTLEAHSTPNDNPVRRIRTAMLAFQRHEEELIRQMCHVNVRGKVVARGIADAQTGKELARFTVEFEGGGTAYIPLDNNTAEMLTANGLPLFRLHSFTPNEDMEIQMSLVEAIQLGILNTDTLESIQKFPTVYPDPNWTFWHQLKRFFAHYVRDADAPMIWHNKSLRFWMPPVLHPSVKRLLLMSATLSEKDIRRTFQGAEIDVTRIKPTAWAPENQVFQIRTDCTSLETLLAYESHWDILGLSEIGQRIFQGICAEIDRDLKVKHAIITNQLTIKPLQNIALKENVSFVNHLKKLEKLDSDFEEPEVLWIVGTPIWEPGIIWRRAQILFGNDEAPLSYETDTEPQRYKDERVQSVYEKNAASLLTNIVGMTGLHRLTGKKIILLSSLELPDITDRPETLLFDWEDFEVAGGLHRLEETIRIREGFEAERGNLNADTSRDEVERVLGCSSRQANRILQKLRGGNIQRTLFREQIFSLLATGEKRTAEIVDAIEGHPTSVRNELKRLVDAGDIIKVRWGIYALPSTATQHP